MLLRLVQRRFGDAVDSHIEQRIATACLEELDTWTARVQSAARLPSCGPTELHEQARATSIQLAC